MESQAGAKDFMFTFHQGVILVICRLYVCAVVLLGVCVWVRGCVEPAGDHREPDRCQGHHVHLPPRGSSSSFVVYTYVLPLLFCWVCVWVRVCVEPAGDHREPGRCQGLHVHLPPRGNSSSVVVYTYVLLFCWVCVCG